MKESTWGILLILALILGFSWFFWKAKPSQEAIQERFSKEATISAELFQSPELKIIATLKFNGSLPVSAKAEEKGRDNPFGGF